MTDRALGASELGQGLPFGTDAMAVGDVEPISEDEFDQEAFNQFRMLFRAKRTAKTDGNSVIEIRWKDGKFDGLRITDTREWTRKKFEGE